MVELQRCYRHPDRETAVSCSECDRPICPDCMVFAPVGIRCPDHSGQPRGVAKVARRAQRASLAGTGALVTKALIALNVIVYLAELAQGAGLSGDSGWIYDHGVLVANAVYGDGSPAGVAHGEWWRLLTTAFLHYGPIHLLINMYALWWLGGMLEGALGRARYLLLYLVSGLAGSAGALLLSPHGLTAGASGAIFGIMGGWLVLEYLQTRTLQGPALTLIVINVAISVGFRGHISLGAHLGGLVGGILGTLALARFGRGHAAYGRLGLVGIASLVAIGVVSIAISYWKVRGHA